ncbi:hypothetical protein HERIO_643 [Hepatospora eriocheir]|uniref:Uncharacterized protein n=1 Tax=Hepatospora eriocheir TaxID=1081669 RepID=A0A1X0QCJ7_9MICR|nr:hypothetical protein HERIO_643 [Hepatospora eriocheir]
MRSKLNIILRSVLFLLSNNNFVIIGVGCEDSINIEEMIPLIKQSKYLFRNFQIGFLTDVLVKIKENKKEFFNKKKGLRDCLNKLNSIKFDDKYCKKMLLIF